MHGSTAHMNETNRVQPEIVAPSAVRYIKLGQSNAWADDCLANAYIALGHDEAPHDLCLAGDWDGVAEAIGLARGMKHPRSAAREVQDFYEMDENCLWITFHAGQMWWARAGAEIIPEKTPSGRSGSRYRRVTGSWAATDVQGKPLLLDQISTKLTKTGSYRQTLCRVDAEDYAIRLINAVENPDILHAKSTRDQFTSSLTPLIASLHESDFEVLVDLIFSRLGWVRVSSLGGLQKDTDLILEQPATKARAIVQVKSAADQNVLDDYEARLGDQPADYRYLICHSPRGDLTSDTVTIWSGPDLATRVAKAGLAEWLFEKAA